jgi:Methyltransferase domain
MAGGGLNKTHKYKKLYCYVLRGGGWGAPRIVGVIYLGMLTNVFRSTNGCERIRKQGLMSNRSSEYSNAEIVLSTARPPSIAASLLIVMDAIRVGQLDLALGLLEAIRIKDEGEVATRLMTANLHARAGLWHDAIRAVGDARKSFPEFVTPQIFEAQLLAELGKRTESILLLQSVVERCPDYPGVAGTLASIRMPGPSYREVLSFFHQRLRPRGYLEIGVETGATLALSKAQCSVGIDPDFSPLRRDKISTDCLLFEMKSSEFFEQNERITVFGNTPLDLVFIDGLHQYLASVTDFAAVEGWTNERTVVVMHDALPVAPIYATTERTTRFWVGDVWKTVKLLLSCRTDLRIRIVPTPPSGLVVITKLKPQMAQRGDWFAADFALFDENTWESGATEWPSDFPVVSNDLAGYMDAMGLSV